MTVTINGTSGIAGVDGSATTPAAKGADTNTGIFYGTDIVGVSTGGTERVRVDASGNVGIGTSSPAGNLHLYSDGTNLDIQTSNNANYQKVRFKGSGGAIGGQLSGIGGSAGLIFYQATTEAARIDSSGNLLVGNTNGANARINVSADSNNVAFFRNSGGTGVYLVSGATSWTTASDERAKDIIEPIIDATSKVSTLRAVIGKYKIDEEGVRRAFLIAQDVQSVLPEAVDATNPEHLGVQYTDVIPLLVAAIKELKAELDATKAEVAALKGAA